MKWLGNILGIDETITDEIILNLNVDYSFKMDLVADGNYKNKPQKILVGTWKKKRNQLNLITKDKNFEKINRIK
jgi:hypothetical protein